MIIDNDSRFCKYCGEKVVGKQPYLWDGEKLKDIFEKVRDTEYDYSSLTKAEFDEKYDLYKNYENKVLSNNDFYKILVDIIFYSGFKASTVDKYLGTIHACFSDYKVVMNYSPEIVEQIKNNPKMIKNRAKIDACVKNAYKINEILEEYDSIQSYIASYNPNASDDCLFKLKKSLEKNFSFIGCVTSYHFLTDIGLNVLKPDRVILRIFNRLGLIKNEKDLFGAVKIGRAFSVATNLPIRYIDIIFVMFGQLGLEKIESICTEKNPKCQKCGVVEDCLYVQ